METRLVPARGYDLRLIPPVPLPRKPTLDLLRVPGRVRRAVADTRAVLDELRPTSSSGSAATWPCRPTSPPAGPGCRSSCTSRTRCRGWPTRSGRGSPPGWRRPRPARRCTGASTSACRCAGDLLAGPRRARAEARAAFGLDADRPTLLVFGGSQGAASLNRAAVAAADALTAAGVQVLHARGPKNTDVTVPPAPRGSRPTWSWTIWSAWTSPTPPPTSPCAGPARSPSPSSRPWGCPRPSSRCPSATASSGATRCPSSRPEAACRRGRRAQPGLDRVDAGAAAHRSRRPGRVRGTPRPPGCPTPTSGWRTSCWRWRRR